MKIFYSNMGGAKGLEKYLSYPIDILVSYYGVKKISRLPFYADLFLDSGAFSAFRKKEVLDPLKYAEFIKTWNEELFVYAGLDVIGDPVKTWENQRTLEREGLSPLPCFHFGENFNWLRRYVDKYEYLAIGGLVPIAANVPQMLSFLDQTWEYIYRTRPSLKVHGFGIQNEKIMMRYPWFSVDATSVHVISRFGGIYTPWGTVKINPEVNFRDAQWQTPLQLKAVEEWVDSLGFDFSFSEARPGTTEATLMRCAISIEYYAQLFGKDYKHQKITNSQGLGFGL